MWHNTFLGLWTAALRLVQRVGINQQIANEFFINICMIDLFLSMRYSQASMWKDCGCMSFNFTLSV